MGKVTLLQDSNRGHIRIICPVKDCFHSKSFTETEFTEKDILTHARRKEFLRLEHEAGRHAASSGR